MDRRVQQFTEIRGMRELTGEELAEIGYSKGNARRLSELLSWEVQIAAQMSHPVIEELFGEVEAFVQRERDEDARRPSERM
jgi:hypothetical protein